DPWMAELPRRHIQLNSSPRRRRKRRDLAKESCAPAPQSHENDVVVAIQPCEFGVGGESGVEYEMLRRGPVGLGPEGDEAEDLFGLLALSQVRVGVAECTAGCILGQKCEHAFLAAAPHRNEVLLDRLLLAVERDRV